MKVRLLFAWYDLWIGAFWDSAKRRLYVLPLPCVGVVIEFPHPQRFFILSAKWTKGDHLVWYRPKSCGYTVDLRQAGTYDASEARQIHSPEDGELAIPVELALAAAKDRKLAENSGDTWDQLGCRQHRWKGQ